eukprot:GHVS01020184.1.p1 GENE.GHVS01020184.1~~GHVS01020184.1.p1  ORF type:complete len:1109 (-),score=73.11 GHVS01020184.1:476-3802(-)
MIVKSNTTAADTNNQTSSRISDNGEDVRTVVQSCSSVRNFLTSERHADGMTERRNLEQEGEDVNNEHLDEKSRVDCHNSRHQITDGWSPTVAVGGPCFTTTGTKLVCDEEVSTVLPESDRGRRHCTITTEPPNNGGRRRRMFSSSNLIRRVLRKATSEMRHGRRMSRCSSRVSKTRLGSRRSRSSIHSNKREKSAFSDRRNSSTTFPPCCMTMKSSCRRAGGKGGGCVRTRSCFRRRKGQDDEEEERRRSQTTELSKVSVSRRSRCRCNSSSNVQHRSRWSSRSAFVLAAVGAAAGLGNFWKFPNLCYEHGGVNFIAAYIILMFLLGLPILVLEFSFGHIFQGGSIKCSDSLHPRLRGVGVGAIVCSATTSTYYAVLTGYNLLYLISCFTRQLPWTLSDDMHDECLATTTQLSCNDVVYCAWKNDCCHPDPTAQAQEFFNTAILGFTSEYELNPTTILWRIALANFVVWLAIFLAIYRGPHMTGQVAYFTMISPLIIITILAICTGSKPGASVGIARYLGGLDMNNLVNSAKLWTDAASQVLFSLSLGTGTMTALASYNPISTHNVVANSLFVALFDFILSFISGIAVFSVIGFLSHSLEMPFDSFPRGFVDLTHITYPIGLASLPGSQVLCAMFFLTMLLLGIDSTFAYSEALVTTLVDSRMMQLVHRKCAFIDVRPFTVLLVSIVSYASGLIYCTRAGIKTLEVVDFYISNIGIIFISLCQGLSVGWIDGWRAQVEQIGPLAQCVFCLSWFAAVSGFVAMPLWYQKLAFLLSCTVGGSSAALLVCVLCDRKDANKPADSIRVQPMNSIGSCTLTQMPSSRHMRCESSVAFTPKAVSSNDSVSESLYATEEAAVPQFSHRPCSTHQYAFPLRVSPTATSGWRTVVGGGSGTSLEHFSVIWKERKNIIASRYIKQPRGHSPRKQLTLKESAWWLFVGNLELLRHDVNALGEGKYSRCLMEVPFVWTLVTKFVVCPLLSFLLVLSLRRGHLAPFSELPMYTFCFGGIVCVVIGLSVIFGLLVPQLFDALTPLDRMSHFGFLREGADLDHTCQIEPVHFFEDFIPAWWMLKTLKKTRRLKPLAATMDCRNSRINCVVFPPTLLHKRTHYI